MYRQNPKACATRPQSGRGIFRGVWPKRYNMSICWGGVTPVSFRLGREHFEMYTFSGKVAFVGRGSRRVVKERVNRLRDAAPGPPPRSSYSTLQHCCPYERKRQTYSLLLSLSGNQCPNSFNASNHVYLFVFALLLFVKGESTRVRLSQVASAPNLAPVFLSR